jgi:hypothetical protein
MSYELLIMHFAFCIMHYDRVLVITLIVNIMHSKMESGKTGKR